MVSLLPSLMLAPDSYSERNLFISSVRSKSLFLPAGDDTTEDTSDDNTRAEETNDNDGDDDVISSKLVVADHNWSG